MTDEDEFAARSQLKWTREGDAWILLYRRRQMGRVVPDKDHSGMWRSVKVDCILSDMANLSWSKDNVMAQTIREVAWNAANDPQKCPVKRGSREQKSPPMRLNAEGVASEQFEAQGGNAIRSEPLPWIEYRLRLGYPNSYPDAEGCSAAFGGYPPGPGCGRAGRNGRVGDGH